MILSSPLYPLQHMSYNYVKCFDTVFTDKPQVMEIQMRVMCSSPKQRLSLCFYTMLPNMGCKMCDGRQVFAGFAPDLQNEVRCQMNAM